MNINEMYESNVRSYCRSFPVTFSKAKLDKLYTKDNVEYLDFFSGASALNYGHNNDAIIGDIIKYLQSDGIMHGLDMYTEAKEEFIKTFVDDILKPRNLEYKLMFCGPTGTNANEAALKIARKHTKRQNVFAFMGAFHGMTMGSLALTSSLFDRGGAGTMLNNVTFMPFPFREFEKIDTIAYMENILTDDHSGIEKPAAIILETVQAEGGVIVADAEWLRRLRKLCDDYDILLIADEIQVGCGRTGTFFSFERAGIVPDIITMSKSISGCGLPMSLLLMKPELDCLKPGEHNGTFRGNQLAFVGAKAAIKYAIESDLWANVKEKGKIVDNYIEQEILTMYPKLKHRGIGLIHAIDFTEIREGLSRLVSAECFKHNLVIECSGRKGNSLKLLPALIISEKDLYDGLQIIKDAIITVLSQNGHKPM